MRLPAGHAALRLSIFSVPLFALYHNMSTSQDVRSILHQENASLTRFKHVNNFNCITSVSYIGLACVRGKEMD